MTSLAFTDLALSLLSHSHPTRALTPLGWSGRSESLPPIVVGRKDDHDGNEETTLA